MEATNYHLSQERHEGQFTCVGCGEAILDQFVLRVAPDMEWHAQCLRCTDCHQQLDETCTCFVRDGKVYCKPDYIRLFGTRCAKCHARFEKNDLVMRAKANIYHVDCFRCAMCGRQLVSGDEFSLRDDARLLCKADHEAVYINNTSAAADDSLLDDVIVSCANNNNNDIDAKTAGGSDTSSSRSETGSPLMIRTADSDSQAHRGTASASHAAAAATGSAGHGQYRNGGRSCGRSGSGHRSGPGEAKTARIRTVLNEKQLHTLRTCYSANSRPDALMKEQLVEMTGLSPRVIRVWFQNKRCKDKKRSIALKQLHQQQQNKDDKLDYPWISLKGVPLIATSPVRHELPQNMLPTPVEVHKYAAPWNDFNGLPSPDMDDIPSPPGVLGGGTLHLPGAGLPLGLMAGTPSSLAVHQLSALNRVDSFADADSFDDDTVVSFDDVSDVVQSQRFVSSAPPLHVDDHAHQDPPEFSEVEGPF